MNRKATSFLAFTTLIAAGAYALALYFELPAIVVDKELDWGGLAACAVFGILAEGMAVDFRIGSGRQARSSLAFLPFLSALTLFPPVPAVTVIILVSAVSQFAL
ncbi:MAG TPA: hypothetical protein VK933_04580, partial [Longimicrobiales bacterium]|nr:hypothetical protein [Longimicrobiales bacterium]